MLTLNDVKRADIKRRQNLNSPNSRSDMPNFNAPFKTVLGSVIMMGEGNLVE